MTHLTIVKKISDIPAEAGARRTMMVKRGKSMVKMYYVALERYMGTKDEDSLGLCGVELSSVTTNCKLTPDQLNYIISRCRLTKEATQPTGDLLSIFYQGGKYFLGLGWWTRSFDALIDLKGDQRLDFLEKKLDDAFDTQMLERQQQEWEAR